MNLPERTLRVTYLSRRPGTGNAVTSLLVFIAFSIISIFNWNDLFGLSRFLIADAHLVIHEHQYWRLLTTLGVHKDLPHLFGNALFFFPFAIVLNGYFGWWIFPALSLLAGALINYLTLLTYPPDVGIIGASGVVYFMVAFWLILYIGIQRQLSIGQRLLRSVGLILAELAPQTFDPQISYSSHLYGFILGAVFGLIYFFYHRGRFRQSEVWHEEVPENLEVLEDFGTVL